MGWALIQGWALIYFLGLQGGRLLVFEMGSLSNIYGIKNKASV